MSSSKEDLERSKGTQEMLKAATNFVVTLFPEVKKIAFSDTSFIKCNQQQKVDLQSYWRYMGRHGTKASLEPGLVNNIEDITKKGRRYWKDIYRRNRTMKS